MQSLSPKNEQSYTPASRFLRSDLACEAAGSEPNRDTPGIVYREYRRGEISVARLRIENALGAERFGREPGTYVTVSCSDILYQPEAVRQSLIGILSSELRRMAEEITEKPVTASFHVLVAGLGNVHMTADALGPKTLRQIPVTRHLTDAEDPLLLELSERYATLSVIAPGVLADTGIEAAELVAAAAREIRPDLIVAVDALAARSCDRLGSTVQLSDAGVHPGSGIGNRRAALNRESIGTPVIVLGVPTVVDSSTLVYDALSRAGISESEISKELLAVLENGTSFFVSPKEIDALTEAFAEILGDAIEQAFSAHFNRFV